MELKIVSSVKPPEIPVCESTAAVNPNFFVRPRVRLLAERKRAPAGGMESCCQSLQTQRVQPLWQQNCIFSVLYHCI